MREHLRIGDLPIDDLAQLIFSELVDAGQSDLPSAHDRLTLGSKKAAEAVVGILIMRGWIRWWPRSHKNRALS